MSNFEAQTTRPLFNQRRSKMLVMKDEVPDISQLSIDSSCETNQSKNESTSKVFLYRGSLSQTQRQSIERKSLMSSPSNKISNRTVVYEGIEDKVSNFFLYDKNIYFFADSQLQSNFRIIR